MSSLTFAHNFASNYCDLLVYDCALDIEVNTWEEAPSTRRKKYTMHTLRNYLLVVQGKLRSIHLEINLLTTS
jgi:hypothetical protein